MAINLEERKERKATKDIMGGLQDASNIVYGVSNTIDIPTDNTDTQDNSDDYEDDDYYDDY